MKKFYIGLHQITDAKHFDSACISIRRLYGRKKSLRCPDVLVDSSAFTELFLYGKYTKDSSVYAKELHRLHCEHVVHITAAVAQDYMCEEFMLKKTGLSVLDHQIRTIRRYDRLVLRLNELFDYKVPFPVMPVLQGYTVPEYLRHVEMYGKRLKDNMWTGVGSVCKRNSDPKAIVLVLSSIKKRRPDLRLHGFGIKVTALKDGLVRELLESSDSQAWGTATYRKNRNQNDWREAMKYKEQVEKIMKYRSHVRKLFV
jgi:hypothetical protein